MDVNLVSRDKFPDRRDAAFRRIGDHGMPAIGEAFELHRVDAVHRHVPDERFG